MILVTKQNISQFYFSNSITVRAVCQYNILQRLRTGRYAVSVSFYSSTEFDTK